MSDEMNRLTEIATEIMDLLDAPSVFDFLNENVGNFGAVDKRLQEVLQTRQSFEIIELAMYLRTSSSRAANLPTWEPLLNATIELARMRGERYEDALYGMMPLATQPRKNTND